MSDHAMHCEPQEPDMLEEGGVRLMQSYQIYCTYTQNNSRVYIVYIFQVLNLWIMTKLPNVSERSVCQGGWTHGMACGYIKCVWTLTNIEDPGLDTHSIVQIALPNKTYKTKADHVEHEFLGHMTCQVQQHLKIILLP